MKIYLPLSSQNFNAIFSTESISPFSFYLQRNFGIKRFFKTEYSLADDFLFFYPMPIFFRIDNSMTEAYPMLLVIDLKELNIDYISELDCSIGKLIAYPKTIYLNLVNFELLFFNNQEKENVLSRAEAGLEVKTLEKYANAFKSVNPNKFAKIDLHNIPRIEIKSPFIFNELKRDKSFNHFKGLIYGYLVGHIGQKNKSEIELRKVLQDIIDNFANMRSDLGISNLSIGERYSSSRKAKDKILKSKPSSNKYDNLSGDNKLVFLKNTLDSIEIAESIFVSSLTNQYKKRDFVSEYIRSKTPSHINEDEFSIFYGILKLIPEIYEIAHTQALKNVKGRSVASFDLLRALVNDYVNNYNSKNYSSIEVEEQIKDIIYDIKVLAEEHFMQQNKQYTLPDLDCFVYEIGDNIQIQYDRFNSNISKQEIQMYEEVIKVLLERPKMKTGEVEKSDILDIIKEIGIRWREIPNIEPSYVQSLRDLYGYLQNKLDEYQVENLRSKVVSNLTAFVFKVDSIEAMQGFIESKGITNSYLAYSFWCVYHGFASLSKTFTRAVYIAENSGVNKYIDNYFAQILHISKVNDEPKYGNLITNQQGDIFNGFEDVKKPKKNAVKKK